MALTTLFGTAQLALQDALRRGLDGLHVPNFIVATLRRASFTREFGWEPRENLDRFRSDLESVARSYAAAHGWGIGGSGVLSINILLDDTDEECTVAARSAQSLYALRITDDHGARSVAVGANPAIVGRAHDAAPRGFVPVYDATRAFSREHLLLRFCDLQLTLRKLGRNLTALNGLAIGLEEMPVSPGDVITCANIRVEIESVRR